MPACMAPRGRAAEDAERTVGRRACEPLDRGLRDPVVRIRRELLEPRRARRGVALRERLDRLKAQRRIFARRERDELTLRVRALDRSERAHRRRAHLLVLRSDRARDRRERARIARVAQRAHRLELHAVRAATVGEVGEETERLGIRSSPERVDRLVPDRTAFASERGERVASLRRVVLSEQADRDLRRAPAFVARHPRAELARFVGALGRREELLERGFAAGTGALREIRDGGDRGGATDFDERAHRA